jgi:4-amino-4-deoxy-L-arabinose transferase-like glycosyltransferase
MFEDIMEYLPFLIPLLIVWLVLLISALIHALRHPNYKIGNRVIWILVIALVIIIGPVLYFTIGRGESTEDDYDEHS